MMASLRFGSTYASRSVRSSSDSRRREERAERRMSLASETFGRKRPFSASRACSSRCRRFSSVTSAACASLAKTPAGVPAAASASDTMRSERALMVGLKVHACSSASRFCTSRCALRSSASAASLASRSAAESGPTPESVCEPAWEVVKRAESSRDNEAVEACWDATARLAEVSLMWGRKVASSASLSFMRSICRFSSLRRCGTWQQSSQQVGGGARARLPPRWPPRTAVPPRWPGTGGGG